MGSVPEIFHGGKVVLYGGDCLSVLKELEDNSIDSCVVDPPYHLTSIVKRFGADDAAPCKVGKTGYYARASAGFMGKQWDGGDIAFRTEVWVEVMRVLKPGGHLVAFGATRGYHRMACAIEDAGFEIRDSLMWLYGCLDELTEVATAEGAKPHHKLVVGDQVICYDLSSGEYSYQPVLEIVEYEYCDTAYRIIGDFGEQVVSRNHRCIIECGGMEIFQLAEEAARKRETRVPVLESLSALQQSLSDAQQGAGYASSPQESQRYGERYNEPNVICHQLRTQVVRAWSGHRTAVVRVVPFPYKGIMWCLRVPTGAFVAVRGGVAFPTGNSGFPKSHDVSKGIDRAAGAEREVLSTVARRDIRNGQGEDRGANAMSASMRVDGPQYIEHAITAPATPEAAEWEGWGTALKPAFEPIVLARKPLSEGTVAANVLRWRTGALNIDGCRVETDETIKTSRNVALGSSSGGIYGAATTPATFEGHAAGRWPANVCHDGSPEVVGAFPETGLSSGGGMKDLRKGKLFLGETNPNVTDACGFGDSGSAARFFYTAKADADDRLGSKHPTVKPVDLIQYLVRLVTPPGGVVLDCFAGTGTTGEAAFREGAKCILVEREEEYRVDIRRRMKLLMAGPDERRRESVKARKPEVDPGPLFGVGLRGVGDE